MSNLRFNARHGISVGPLEIPVIDISGNITTDNITSENATITGDLVVSGNIAGGGLGSPLTTKGDLYGFSSTHARVPIGADDYILTANSAATLGLSWELHPAAGMIYPGVGIATSTGSGWGTSYTTSGTGNVVALTDSPVFVTPLLGTPTSGNLSNCTASFISNISATNLSGINTGDQNLSGYALLSGATFVGNISAPNLSGVNTGDQNLSGYVRYIGATANVALGTFNLTATNLTANATVRGSTSTGTSVNSAVVGLATTSGWGVFGSSSSSVGIYGMSNSNSGVYGLSTSGIGTYGYSTTGTGLFGFSVSSYAIEASADTSLPLKAALRLVPQDANPSIPLQGDIYVNSGDGSLRWYNGTVWNTAASESAYVPYTGAIGNVDLGAFDVTATNLTANAIVRGNATTGTGTSSAVVGVATTTGEGVYGSSADGIGVHGVSTTYHGMYGQSTTGPGVYGFSDGGNGVNGFSVSGVGVSGGSVNHYGVTAQGDLTSPGRAAFRIIPQDANPSTPQQGDIYVNSGDGSLRWHNGTAWQIVNAATIFESAEQTYTSNAGVVISVTHNLGVVPKNIRTVLRCVIAEHGYSIGDEVDITSVWGDVTGVGNMRVYAWTNATHVGVAGAYIQTICNRNTGAEVTPTTANWRWVFYASTF